MKNFLHALALCCLAASPTPAENQPLTLEKGDTIAWIGNTFAERMQYFGDIETQLHARYPEHGLIVRNIAWPADTVSKQPRPPKFGDIHHYLDELGADVILACFGVNETWEYGGEDGLDTFEKDLAAFLSGLQSRTYNTESHPEIVLYSPIATEDSRVPRHQERNRLLTLYTERMSKVASEQNIHFIDLLTASLNLFDSNNKKLTINGLHLSQEGYQKLAPAVWNKKIFKPLSNNTPTYLANIKREVLEKNDSFFQWYRTVNSFYIHGERKDPFGVVNFPRERKKLLQMTTIRDQRIAAVAQGKAVPAEIDDSGTVQIPEKIVSPRKVAEALSPEDEKETFIVDERFEVSLFASEEEFDDLRNPVCCLFDAKGRLWVATMPSYPHALPGVKPNDKILIFEDTDNDGRADKRTVFAEGLYLPLGFELGDGGVYVSQEPNLVFLKDTDGDDRADESHIIFHGFGSEDSHHAIHNFVWGQGGGLYMQESVFQHSQVETVHGPIRTADNNVFRYEPRTGKFEVIARKGAGGNPWGHAINRWGERLYVGQHLNGSLVRQPHPPGFNPKVSKITSDTRFCGQEFIYSRHFPDEMQGKVFANIYKNYHGVLLEDWTENGSTFKHDRLAEVLEAKNTAFIPVDLKIAPDGSLYLLDWYNPVLGHMQYSLRDERRDYDRGRIWRITYKGRPLLEPATITGQPVEKLLGLLKTYEDRTRYRVRRELWKIPAETLRPALNEWIASLDKNNPDFAWHQLEALWLHQQRGWVNEELLESCLTSPDHRSRSAATHLLRFWSEELSNTRKLFLIAANDSHPKVRLEAVVSATWVSPEIAVETLDAVSALPKDESLQAAYDNATRALKPALQNHPMMIPADKLAKMSNTPAVFRALTRRTDIPDNVSLMAAFHLSTDEDISHAEAILKIMLELGKNEIKSFAIWQKHFDSLSNKELAPITGILTAELAENSNPSIRQSLIAALIRLKQEVVQSSPDYFSSISKIKDGLVREGFRENSLEVANDETAPEELRGAALFSIGYFSLEDYGLFQELAKHLDDPVLSSSAAEALLTRGAASWPDKEALELLTESLERLAATPVSKRGEPAFLLNSKLFTQIARKNGLVSEAETIAGLQLETIRITSVPDRLSFDKTTVEVKAGSPVELIFDNADGLKHNIIISTPGSLEAVGKGVDAMLSQPDAMAKDWIPEMKEVLFATPMADPESEVHIRFITPEEPGEYPYICTVPGHWRIMKGIMIVK